MARITSYDPNTHRVKVLILPEGDHPMGDGQVAETGWIPIDVGMSGNGWGIYAAPTPGDQVMVVHQENHAGAPVVVARINDTSNAAPAGVLSGEIWLVHSSGSLIKLTNDEKLSINGKLEIDVSGPTINITANGNSPLINISAAGGTVNVTGDHVNLGAVGGKRVVRDGDPCTSGGHVNATTTLVSAG